MTHRVADLPPAEDTCTSFALLLEKPTLLRHDHRPYALKRLLGLLENSWTRHFIRPQLDHLGVEPMIMKPWFFKIYGEQITLGDAVHVVTAKDRTVRLTTWRHADGCGQIEIGNYALLCPGVRIDSATLVRVGANTMLAAGVYVTDADWHDIYDRTKAIGSSKPVILGDNTWIGDGSTICKGVEIGDNSIIGTGSVVTRSIPANVIAAGNPATVIRHLDPHQDLTPRSALLAEHAQLRADIDGLERMLRKQNTWIKWIKSVLAPGSAD